jgi:hypothetical protein
VIAGSESRDRPDRGTKLDDLALPAEDHVSDLTCYRRGRNCVRLPRETRN